MPQIISQGLTLPANVVTGGTIQATDVSTLYATLNALSIPDNVASLVQSVYSTVAGTTVFGGTSTAAVNIDVALSPSVPNTKTLFAIGSYYWSSTGVAISLQYRVNGTVIASPQAITTQISGSGMFFVIVGPHDVNTPGAVVGWQTGSTGNTITFTASTPLNLTASASTSFGIGALIGTSSNGSTGSAVALQFVDIWRGT